MASDREGHNDEQEDWYGGPSRWQRPKTNTARSDEQSGENTSVPRRCCLDSTHPTYIIAIKVRVQKQCLKDLNCVAAVRLP